MHSENHLVNDRATTQRAIHLCELMNEYLRNRTPQERDRTMQIHLAQARGTKANAYLLGQAMNFGIRIRTMRAAKNAND